MFLDLTFPQGVAAGVRGGPERRVEIVTLASGAEERNARWQGSRRRYDAAMGVRTADDLAAVLAFFEEVRGPLHSFRFRDWSDFSTAPAAVQFPTPNDMPLGAGDGATAEFQLVKVYGGLLPYSRAITKPVAGSVRVALDGVEQSTGWAVDNTTGVVTFTTPPAPGVAVTAGCLFDVPVRFDTDRLEIDMALFSEADGRGLGRVPSIPLVEVLE